MTFRAFTTSYPTLVNVLTTEVRVSIPALPGEPKPKALPFIAIWDTGATGTVITKAAALELGLLPTGQVISHGVHGPKEVNTYIIDLRLPNQVVFGFLQVTECDSLSSDGKTHILIGMNVIAAGDFAVTNKDGKTVMTFCMPSRKTIDFVKDVNAQSVMPEGLNREQKRNWEKKNKKP